MRPWQNCTQTVNGKNCWQLFKNGICDKQCNSQKCLYDGFDCVVRRIDWLFVIWGLHLCLHVCLPLYSVCKCQCLPLCVCVCIFVFLPLCERERERGVCVCIWERESACVCVGACERESVRECVGESVWVCWGERERGQEWVSLLVYAEILHMFCLNKAIITAVALNWFRTCCGNERP